MQYSVAVHKGMERDALQQLKAAFGFGSVDARMPMKDYLRRGKGAWVPTTSVLFPGYLIVSSFAPLDNARIAHILGATFYDADPVCSIRALSDDEARLVHSLTAFNSVVGFSRGVMRSGRLQVLSGPLVGLESVLGKVDRHKRKAYFKQGIFPNLTRPELAPDAFVSHEDKQPPLYLGLEVSRKQ